jgi:hypothetical protein
MILMKEAVSMERVHFCFNAFVVANPLSFQQQTSGFWHSLSWWVGTVVSEQPSSETSVIDSNPSLCQHPEDDYINNSPKARIFYFFITISYQLYFYNITAW